jgi:ribosomal protein S18 acetylase RimI-like enzyme
MGDFDLVTAGDIRLMQGLAQRVTAIRPDLVNSDASFGELAWIWGKGHACDRGTWPGRLWSSGDALVAWAWAYLPHQVRRSDGSVTDVTGAYLGYQVHPGHAALVDEVIGWYDAAAAGLERTVAPSAADEFALKRWAAHGYKTDPASATYRGDLHVLVKAPDGTMAASTIMWLDEANKTAEFEPVGTHPGYRRLRLGTAMLLHGMHLAREAGGHSHDGRLPGCTGAPAGARAVLRSRVPAVHAGRAAHQARALEPRRHEVSNGF